jgi:exodeoxyribonuclease V alpha subunit
MLRHSHRFSADSGIGRLAEAVNAGEATAAQRILADGHADLTLLPVASPDEDALRHLVIDGGYRHYLQAIHRSPPGRTDDQATTDAWASAVLTAHSRFQVLCALRRGPWGVQGLNLLIARMLRQAGLISATDDWYAGRPVLVTRNDAALGLMNGDIGITLPLDTGTGTDGQAPGLRVAFRDVGQPGGVRWVLPVRLQAVETVYALTVHKSQGSEFDHVALLLPDAPSPILTRELLYTGITRARSHLTLVRPGAPRVLQEAVLTRVLRASGLMESD